MTSLFAPQIEARHTMPVQRTGTAGAWTPIPPQVTYVVRRPAAVVPLCWALVVLAIVGLNVPALLVGAAVAAVGLVVTVLLWRRGVVVAAARTEAVRRRPGRHAAPSPELTDSLH